MADKSKKIDIIANILIAYFKIQRHMTFVRSINYPDVSPCIFATWHGSQFCFFGMKDFSKLNILISKSNDGEIITRATESLGFHVVRGSKGRNGTQATLKLLEKIEQGENIGVTLDGPKGPKYVAKKGVINMAKIAQVPIVPVYWYCDSFNFVKFNTWDEFSLPFGPVKMIHLCGEPIYVPADIDDDEAEIYRQKVETSLLDLQKRVKSNYKELVKQYF